MPAEPVEARPVEEPKALAPVPEVAPAASLFGSTPDQVVENASKVARSLVPVIEQARLYKDIQGRRHVLVDGWTTLGAMIGLLPQTESRRLDREGGDEIAYEAICRVIQPTTGKVFTVADAMASSKERGTWGRNEFSIRSMAQTRATGKAFRLALGWVMNLAGYEACPGEEMDEGHPGPAKAPQAPSVRHDASEAVRTSPAQPQAPPGGWDSGPIGDSVISEGSGIRGKRMRDVHPTLLWNVYGQLEAAAKTKGLNAARMSLWGQIERHLMELDRRGTWKLPRPIAGPGMKPAAPVPTRAPASVGAPEDDLGDPDRPPF